MRKYHFYEKIPGCVIPEDRLMKKRKYLALAAALLLSVFLSLEAAVVFAEETEDTEDTKESLTEILEEIEDNKEALEEGKKKEKSLASQVNELEKELGRLSVAIDEGEAKLAVLEKELEAAQKKVDIQNKNLNARLRNMYKNGNVGFMDVLFDSSSFSEFLTNLDLVKKIYASDQDVLNQLQKAHDEVEAKKNEVQALQNELEYSKSVTQTQKTEIEDKKAEIAASNEETEKMLDELKAEADAMTAKLKSEASSSATSIYTGGEFDWPTPSTSYITSPFGYRIHPISGTRKFHTGIDIGASYGSSIVAANSGTVILAGWNGGYGKCVVVDHGGGYSTLYAHASAILVNHGETVARGQEIAQVGSTGNSTGPHLHYEIRINGEYQNPMNYY